MLGARVDASVLVPGVGIDSQPLARFVNVIIIIIIILGGMAIISIHGIRCCSRGHDCRCHCLFRQHLLMLLLLLLLMMMMMVMVMVMMMMSQPIEVMQIRLGIPEELSEGIVVPSVVHQVLDGPHAPYFGIDGVVLQFKL